MPVMPLVANLAPVSSGCTHICCVAVQDRLPASLLGEVISLKSLPRSAHALFLGGREELLAA